MPEETLTTQSATTPTEPNPTPAPTSTETKPDAPTNQSLLSAESPAEPDPAPKPAGAPDAYADFKLPDGFELAGGVLDEATPILRELNLTQEQAQKLVDFYTKQNKASVDSLFEKQMEVRRGWRTESETYLKDNGGAAAVKGEIGKFLNSVFAGKDGVPDPKQIQSFREGMDMTGAGDFAPFVKAFHIAAKAYNEGKAVQGSRPSPLGQANPSQKGPVSLAHAMFPNLANPPQGG